MFTSGDLGRHHKNKWDGTRSKHLQRSTKHAKPEVPMVECHQESPKCPHVWAAWKKACNVFTKKGKLIRPLGKWLHDPKHLGCQWPAVYDPTDDVLYLYRPNDSYSKHRREHNGFQFDYSTSHYCLPTTAVLVDVICTDNLWRFKRAVTQTTCGSSVGGYHDSRT